MTTPGPQILSHAKAPFRRSGHGEKRRLRPNLNFIMQLEVWQDTGYEIYEDVETKTPKLQYKESFEKTGETIEGTGIDG